MRLTLPIVDRSTQLGKHPTERTTDAGLDVVVRQTEAHAGSRRPTAAL